MAPKLIILIKDLISFLLFKVLLMFLYAEQDVNLAWQSCLGLKNWKRKKNFLKSGKILFCSQDGMGCEEEANCFPFRHRKKGSCNNSFISSAAFRKKPIKIVLRKKTRGCGRYRQQFVARKSCSIMSEFKCVSCGPMSIMAIPCYFFCPTRQNGWRW